MEHVKKFSLQVMFLSIIGMFKPFVSKGSFFVAISVFLFTACEDKTEQLITWTAYEPIYMTAEELVASVNIEEPRNLSDPGKIYFYNNYLFVNERNKGVHIIDNTFPTAPSIIGFVNVPGSHDLAIRNGLLYVNAHTDLLVINLKNFSEAEVVHHEADVFDFPHPGFPYNDVDESKGLIVGWEAKEMEEYCDGDCYAFRRHGDIFLNDRIAMPESNSGSTTQSGMNAIPSAGVAGSMARFAIYGNYLYAVDDRQLLVFDITGVKPNLVNETDVGEAIETIFPYDNGLFIGSRSAMYIYDITSPANPVQLSRYSHIIGCDPVVVEGNYAYVTIRDGEECRRSANRLEVINIENRSNPKEVGIYDMINPHGLGIDNGNLFISEGEHGLKILDAKDPKNIKHLRHIEDIKTFDVIPYKNVLMVTGESGIVQYDYSNINNLVKLSTIPVY